MKKLFTSYWNEESGAEDVKQILFYVLGFALAVAVGFAIWSFVGNNTKRLDNVMEQTQNPTDDPFGAGTNPFG